MRSKSTSSPVRAAAAIRSLIVEGALGPQAALPSERDLAEQLGFSYMTIRSANQLLEEQGTVRREPGRGTFVVQPPLLGAPPRSGDSRKLVGYVYVTDLERQGYVLRQFEIMERTLKSRGYPVVLGVLHNDEFGRVLPSSFDTLHLDALIVDGHLSQAYLRKLVTMGKPVVVAGNHAAHDRVPCVRLDFRAVSRLMTKALLDQGMETVCMISEPLTLDYTRDLWSGYRDGLLEAKRGPEIVSVTEMDGSSRLCLESLRQAFARFGPKLGILGYYNFLGQHLKQLAGEGVDVGQCIAVIGPRERVERGVKHIVCEFPVDQVAMEAAESLCRLLEGKAVTDKVLRPVLRDVALNGRANFEWQVCPHEEQPVDAVARKASVLATELL